MNLLERLQYDWDRGQMIQRLIMVNVFVFFLVNIMLGLMGLWDVDAYSPVSRWLALSPKLSKFITAPWTLISYGFLHHGFLHILFNMLWLYWIGKILEEYIGGRKVLPVYIYGVIAGGLLMILFYNIFPAFTNKEAPMVGASAGVMAIIWATVALLPDYKFGLLFIGAVPLIYIAAIMTGLDLIAISGSNAGGVISHIGGALMGYWFIKLYQRGNDLSVGFNKMMDSIATAFSGRKRQRQTPKFTVKRGGKNKGAQQLKTSSKNNQQDANLDTQIKIDAILDKINKSGYASLSQKEKDFLNKQSLN